MFRTSLLVASASLLLLSGCVDGEDFGGSGGSNSGSLSLARDVCVRTASDQGLNVARIDSAEEYAFGNNPPRGIKVVMQVRRDAMSVNTQPRVCRFSYANGTADISRT